MAVVALLPAFALYLAHLSTVSNTYVGLRSTTLLVSTAMGLGCALGATAAFSALCVLPLRYAGFQLRRQPQSFIDIAGPREESFAITKRVAAIVLLCMAVGMVRLGDRLVPERTIAYSVRINVNNSELVGWNTLSRGDQTPINAMAQWVNPNVRWLNLLLCSGSSTPVFSQANWLTFPLNLSTATTPAAEEIDEHPQDQP
jgi:hypothetical protein